MSIDSSVILIVKDTREMLRTSEKGWSTLLRANANTIDTGVRCDSMPMAIVYKITKLESSSRLCSLSRTLLLARNAVVA